MLKRIVTVLLVITAVGVGRPLAAQSDPDMKELAAYRLTRPSLDKYMAVMRTLAVEIQKDPQFRELKKVEADIKTLEAKEDLSDAQQTQLEQLEGRKDELEDHLGGILGMGADGDLNDMEARIKGSPAAVAALRAASFPPRDFAKFTLVMFQTAMASGLKKAGMLKELPEGVAPENIKFVEDNAALFEAMQKEMEALNPK